MRIEHLEIRNIRAVHRVEIETAGNVVLIAGPNGCGKSCVFDAIRLMKSLYGGYQQNEWHQWFGEYGININRTQDLSHLFRDKTAPIVIAAEFVLTNDERAYLESSLAEFARQQAWEIVAPHTQQFGLRPVARDNRAYEKRVDELAAEIVQAVTDELGKRSHHGRIEILPSREFRTSDSPLLEVVFSAYEPNHLGIIDFHGANRAYGREQLGAINLGVEDHSERDRNSRLYNYSQKYSNIKSEMATSYIRSLIAKELGDDIAGAV